MEETKEKVAGSTEDGVVRKSTNWLVKHVGLNGKERRRMRRIVRTGIPGSADVKLAKLRLDKSPKNLPVRKIQIDGRVSYVFEPHYQAGMQAYRETYATELQNLFDDAIDNNKPAGKQELELVTVAASRAFIKKLLEFVRPSEPVNV